ncbi:MAG: outer membrane protein assembly factor BamE [Thiobacillus sp.]|uniref:outer membrane protein assembly factor BamE domain-containing protein n=1 Tax=Thiobacillus sp. TaxID=924 RepID=UPI0027351BB9|nr:outer membrane protein assembly factor BamE [Thiobacillus sp.]MDP3584336.1 outer membrane protein assembly factor BamE [Thiobacillus sp.]
MRHILISVLLVGLVAGCSTPRIGPHRIDVQQGNALDQENVARLKPGLNRSQVRFLLGTPLVVDPFRTDRWDYVYVFYKAGKLAEQKRITLFFDGDTLARIEGDLPPPPEPAAEPQPVSAAPQPGVAAVAPTEPKVQPMALAAEPAPVATPVKAAPVAPLAAPTSAAVASTPSSVAKPAPAALTPAPAPVAAPAVAARAADATPQEAPTGSSIVQPLPSPKNVPAYVDPRPRAELSLQPETNVMQIQPDVIPAFPDPNAVPADDAAVLKAVNEWAAAWSRRDEDAYLAAYDASFVPQGGGSRADWEKRRRLLLGVAQNIDLKIDSPSVARSGADGVTVTFNQFYQSGAYRDAVVKQLRMVERNGRWLIAEEKVVSILRGIP